MGIPKFYRWLTRRYPLTVAKILHPEDVPPIDNLYLDMNGLIHMAVHGNSPDRHLITSRLCNSGNIDDLWAEIFRYIDEVVNLASPRKLLFMGVDSVTPATKMIQQRARRIKEKSAYDESCEKAKEQGEKELFDINAISPGTDFMRILNEKLAYFVNEKLKTDPKYQKLKIILSDSNVPGEGEHKIMSYLRQYKAAPDYDPNLRHCIYGMDADLIMLTLVSHEPNMMIIREIMEQRPPNQNLVKGITRATMIKTQEYELLYINVLREYFEAEFAEFKGKLKVEFDLERIIDDFVFFSLFVGNDFVPYLCTVDINYGSLDEIVKFYKKILPELTSYITHKGSIMWSQAEKIFQELAKYELEQLNYRYADSVRLAKNEAKSTSAYEDVDKEQLRQKIMLEKKKKKIELLKAEGKIEDYLKELNIKLRKTKEKTEKTEPEVKAVENEKIEKLEKVPSVEEDKSPVKVTIRAEDLPDSEISDIDEAEIVEDSETSPVSAEKNKVFYEKICNVYKTSANNAKQIYYQEKLGFDITNADGKDSVNTIIKRYLEGLQWVLYYYYTGVKHWGWFYPYYYAPLVSDITSPQNYFYDGQELTFDHLMVPNSPITPFQQLLSILPKYSMNLLPACYHQLYDEGSEIAHYYPSHYQIDYNGREMPWEAIKIIPFVDTRKIIEAEKAVFASFKTPFTPEENARNTLHSAFEYVFNGTCVCSKEYAFDSKVQGFLPILSSKAEIPCYDLPSLKWLNVSACRIVSTRKREKVYDCAELMLKSNEAPKKFESLLRDIAYIGYPFQKEVAIVGIVSDKSYICLSEDWSKVVKEHINDSRQYFEQARMFLQEKRLGVVDMKFVCICQFMDTISKNYQMGGALEKVYSESTIIVPGELVMTVRNEKHYQNIESLLTSQAAQFPLNSNCIQLAEPNFGAVGKIQNNSIYGSVVVRLSDTPPSIKDMENNIEVDDKTDSFVTLQSIAAKTGYSNYTISRLTSSIKVFVRKSGATRSTMKKYNVGLSLKSQAQGMHIPYHVKYDAWKRKWMVSRKIEEIIADYIKNFNEVLKVIEKTESRDDDTIFADAIYPKAVDPEENLKDIMNWISALPISKLPFVPIGSKLFAAGSESKLESVKTADISGNGKTVKVNLKNVFTEIYPYWPTPFAETLYYHFQLGDRVINVNSGCAPFGMKGRIVSLHNEKIVVEFDTPIVTGSSFWGQCKKGCGKLVDASSIINLSMKCRGNKKPRKYNESKANYSKQYSYKNEATEIKPKEPEKPKEQEKIKEPEKGKVPEKEKEVEKPAEQRNYAKQQKYGYQSYYGDQHYQYSNGYQNQQYYYPGPQQKYYYPQPQYSYPKPEPHYYKEKSTKFENNAVVYKKKETQ